MFHIHHPNETQMRICGIPARTSCRKLIKMPLASLSQNVMKMADTLHNSVGALLACVGVLTNLGLKFRIPFLVRFQVDVAVRRHQLQHQHWKTRLQASDPAGVHTNVDLAGAAVDRSIFHIAIITSCHIFHQVSC